MGDCFPGEIRIGGILRLSAPKDQKQEDWDDLIGRFLTYFNDTAPEFGENGHSVKDVQELREIAKEFNGTLPGCDDEALGGQFDDLEEVCRELGLEYDRWSDSLYEYDGEYCRWRPGMTEPFVVEANNNGVPVCDRAPILDAFRIVKNMMEDKPESLAINKGNLRTVFASLRSALYAGEEEPVEPADISLFRIVP